MSPSKYFPEPIVPRYFDTMPCSPIIDSYKINLLPPKMQEITSKQYTVKNFYVAPGEIYVNYNSEMVSYLNKVWRDKEPTYADIYYKWPKRFGICSRATVDNDRKLKMLKWVDYQSELKSLFTMDGKVSLPFELAEFWVRETLSAMSWGDHVEQYVNDHATSHPCPGFTWRELWDKKMMRRFQIFTTEVMKVWNDNFDNDLYNWSLSNLTRRYGNRQRSPELGPLSSFMTYTLERSRQIGYNPGPSSCNAFVPHDKQIKIMEKVFKTYEDIIHCKIYCPKIHGGRIYQLLRDAYLEGKTLMNYDVAGMEIITPSIIANSTNKFPFGLGMVIGWLSDVPELLSGVAPTSDYDMIAHLELLSKLIVKTPEFIVILGDDCTLVNGEVKNNSLYERQLADERIHRTLGLTCTELIHPVGLNITVDTAKKRMAVVKKRGINELPISLGESKWYENKRPLVDRWRDVEYFTGYIDQVPVSDIIGKIPPQAAAYSPREMIEIYLDLSATT